VIKAGKTTYEVVDMGLKLLQGRRETDKKSRVFGVVINGFDIKKSDQYYYQYYNYYPSAEERSKQ
jgi:hypothetical protein